MSDPAGVSRGQLLSTLDKQEPAVAETELRGTALGFGTLAGAPQFEAQNIADHLFRQPV